MTLVIENQLFPCIDYIKILIKYSNINIEQYETFQKMSFRNRYIIYGASGLNHLTIPLLGGREQKTLIREIRMENSTHWRTKHWRGIISAYRKAPFFEHYEFEVHKLLFAPDSYLFDFNFNILLWLQKLFDIKGEVGLTEKYEREHKSAEDYRNILTPKTFQQASHWQPRYTQVFENKFGFQPNLSILDLLFCQGPNAKNLLHTSVNSFR